MADGPLTYLSSNRDSSRRLAKYIRKKLGDLGTRSKISKKNNFQIFFDRKKGETIVENFDSIDSENELAAAHTFVAEIIATQRSSTDRDMILKYADAFYAEFADQNLVSL